MGHLNAYLKTRERVRPAGCRFVGRKSGDCSRKLAATQPFRRRFVAIERGAVISLIMLP